MAPVRRCEATEHLRSEARPGSTSCSVSSMATSSQGHHVQLDVTALRAGATLVAGLQGVRRTPAARRLSLETSGRLQLPDLLIVGACRRLPPIKAAPPLTPTPYVLNVTW